MNYPTFAAGEEKTIVQFPKGFGARLNGDETWRIYYMLHNWVSKPEFVYIVWTLDYVPLSSPAAASLKPVETRWMGVAKNRFYPVFDALRGEGRGGKFTFPDQASGAKRALRGEAQSWVLDRDMTLVYSTGHLHPGGLYMDLTAERSGVKRRLLHSKAVYFSDKPKSYDFAMTVPPPGWRVKLRRGDRVSVSATIATKGLSWHDSMGIMPVAAVPGHGQGGVDPFRRPLRALSGSVTHGSLPENFNPGGRLTTAPDPRALPDGPEVSGPVSIQNFRFRLGGFSSERGLPARPPVVRRGQSLSFVNRDSAAASSPFSAYHTVTACAAPCNETTGAAYPVEDAGRAFDSGQLGVSVTGRPPASGRLDWSTPRDLPSGTYTFFCRIHPDMRGAFRVKDASGVASVSAGWPALRGG